MKQVARYRPAHIKTPLIYLCYKFVVFVTFYIANKIVGTERLASYCYGQIFLRFHVINRLIRKTYENL